MEDRFEQLATLMNEVVNEAYFHDGQVDRIGALSFEALERAVHNVVERFRPSRVDSEVMPCHWNCEYCKAHDTPSK